MKTPKTTARPVYPVIASRENAAFLKAALDAKEKRFFVALDALHDAELLTSAALATCGKKEKALRAKAAAEATIDEADRVALDALTARRAARREFNDAADKYAAAVIKFAWTRDESVLRRAYDSGRRAAPLADAEADEKARAQKGGASDIIRKLKPESAPTARRLLLMDYNDEARAASLADRLSDAADIISTACLAVLETAENRAENRAEAAAAQVGIFDFEYIDAADHMKKPACDVKRVNRNAERYVNGRRGLALSDFRTLYIEDFSEEQDAAEAFLLHRARGVYAALASDTVTSGYTVKKIDALLAALGLTPTERRRLGRVVGGMNQAEVARAENVTEKAVSKSIAAAREKALAALARAEANANKNAAEVAEAARAAFTEADARLSEARARLAEAEAAEDAAAINAARAEVKDARAEANAAKAAVKDAEDGAKAKAYHKAAAALLDIQNRNKTEAAAPLYTKDYKTALFPRHIARALDAVKAALAEDALLDENDAFNTAFDRAEADAARARRALAYRDENAAALDAAAAAKVAAARAVKLDEVAVILADAAALDAVKENADAADRAATLAEARAARLYDDYKAARRAFDALPKKTTRAATLAEARAAIDAARLAALDAKTAARAARALAEAEADRAARAARVINRKPKDNAAEKAALAALDAAEARARAEAAKDEADAAEARARFTEADRAEARARAEDNARARVEAEAEAAARAAADRAAEADRAEADRAARAAEVKARAEAEAEARRNAEANAEAARNAKADRAARLAEAAAEARARLAEARAALADAAALEYPTPTARRVALDVFKKACRDAAEVADRAEDAARLAAEMK